MALMRMEKAGWAGITSGEDALGGMGSGGSTLARRVLRPINSMETWGVTRKGYPQNTTYYLQCGHHRGTARPERAHIHLFLIGLLAEGRILGPIRIKCYDCSTEAERKDQEESR